MMIYEKPIIMPITVEEIEKGNYQFKFGNLINEDGSWGDSLIIPAMAFKTKDLDIRHKIELDPLNSLPDELMDYYKAYCKLDKDDDISSRSKKEITTYEPNYGKETVDSTWKVLWTLVKNNIDDLQLQKELIQDMIDAQEKVIEVQMKVMDYLKKAKEEL